MAGVFMRKADPYPLIFVPLVGLAWLLLSQTALANPQPRLMPSDLQRLSRDLIPSSSEDFFRAGQVKLEREVQRLTEPRSLSEKVLIINPSIQKQQEAIPTETPKKP